MPVLQKNLKHQKNQHRTFKIVFRRSKFITLESWKKYVKIEKLNNEKNRSIYPF